MEDPSKSQAGSVDVKPPLPFPPGGMMIPGAAGIVRVPPPAAAAARGRGAGAQGSGAPARYKKAPDAPKRFKSAFIIFSAEKHKEIKEAHLKVGRTEKTTDIAKLVSEAWRQLVPDEKEVWEKKARKDKARYEVEKAMYKGPWKIPANKRTPKDPTAPKRPMSAFLAFSNKRRAGLKRQTPNATNADLSKMLSKTWKEADPDLRQKYMGEEAELRGKYKVEMAKWRKRVAEEKKAERREREALAMQAAEARQNQPPEQLVQGAEGQDAAGMPGGPQGMFANPYAMGDMSGLAGGPGGFNPLMGNPFAAQFGLPGAAMQLQLSQLLANQQFLQNRGAFGLYGQGLPNQAGGQQMGGQNMQNPGLAGFGSMDIMNQQRAMMEAQQGGALGAAGLATAGGTGNGGETKDDDAGYMAGHSQQV